MVPCTPILELTSTNWAQPVTGHWPHSQQGTGGHFDRICYVRIESCSFSSFILHLKISTAGLWIQTTSFPCQQAHLSKIQSTLMGSGITFWPSNSLLIPATTSVITIILPLCRASWEKHCWQKDLQNMITQWIKCRTKHSVMHTQCHNEHHVSL